MPTPRSHPSADSLWDEDPPPGAWPGAEAAGEAGGAWEEGEGELDAPVQSTPAPPPDRPPMASALEDLFAAILTALADGAVPDLDLASLRAANAAAGGAGGRATTLGGATTTLSLTARGARGAGRYARLLLAGAAAHEALVTGRSLTQRDLYYSLKSVGASMTPAGAAAAVADLTAHFRAPRAAFGVVAASRGAVGGQVWVADGGGGGGGGGGDGGPCASPAPLAWTDLSTAPTGRPLPGDPAALARLHLRTGAAYLLIIEKDAIFRRLCEDRVWDRLPGGAALVTSGGWPATGVRAFVSALRAAAAPGALHTALGVCDWNPAGVGILTAYKYGTRRAAVGCSRGGGGGSEEEEEEEDQGGGEAGAGGRSCPSAGVDPHALPAMGWLGLRSARLAAAPPETFQPLTARDRAVAATLAAGPLAAHPAWTAELELMAGAGLKAELEAVDAVGGLGSLTDALVEDVCAGAWAA